MQEYSESFKRKMVQRLLLPDGPSANALAKEVGVPQSSLSRWLRSFGTVWGVPNDNNGTASGPRRPEDWPVKERLRAVVEAEKLGEEELGEFLRREGLHEETLAEWSAAVHEALAPSHARERAGASDKKRIQKLEKELARKERELAAANAVVTLQKKVHALWGDADDDTNPGTDK
jgi:transposase-like protein